METAACLYPDGGAADVIIARSDGDRPLGGLLSALSAVALIRQGGGWPAMTYPVQLFDLERVLPRLHFTVDPDGLSRRR